MPKSLNVDSYNSIDNSKLYEYTELVRSKFPNDATKRQELAKNIMPKQLYLYYLVNELQMVTSMSAYCGYNGYNEISEISITTGALENLLRAMSYMLSLIYDEIPEQRYNYIESKSSTFFRELNKAVEKNMKIFEKSF